VGQSRYCPIKRADRPPRIRVCAACNHPTYPLPTPIRACAASVGVIPALKREAFSLFFRNGTRCSCSPPKIRRHSRAHFAENPILSPTDDLYRETARVPRGLTPRVNRGCYMMHPTVLVSTVATWVNALNPKQLPAVARKCDTSQTPATAGATGVVGRGGAADPHGRCGAFGCEFQPTLLGKGEGN